MLPLESPFQLHCHFTSPQVWKDLDNPKHPLNLAWPEFLDQDETYKVYSPKLLEYPELSRYQFAVTRTNSSGRQQLIACARSIPFFWPELAEVVDSEQDVYRSHKLLQTLPDGGYDTILSRGYGNISPPLTTSQYMDISACQSHDPPNAISAISVTVHPDYRRMGLAEALIETMIQTAKEASLRILVTPLRPTRKADFADVPMTEYILWQREAQAGCRCSISKQPFDPWLRKHVILGAKIVKVAESSMVVRGSVEDWELWTGIPLTQNSRIMSSRKMHYDSDIGEPFTEIYFPGGLAPLRLYAGTQEGVYIEPNVWLCHRTV
ncbi:hypothetical protein BGW36DRAFT_400522 [Talaromyces proteolyticus]|uniref:N-acetyltransferase domain-containing protein n=1 Tax=Talaromyces proteolyticus TaxID=1131652 RepID=A0AAD4PSF6_9EURO|nr:uncharacterized protein BGW36DRAFT_400522 [Talaromyces proteolyticus]KAH8691176.1 hypothetical protein BGW36DRAFT_400522 [Talaromyces proteolyticus]